MNKKIIRKLIGKIMILYSLIMIIPLIVAIIYKEYSNIIAFLIPGLLLALIGSLLNIKKARSTKIMPLDAFIIVGIAWFMLSIFGCLPFIISREIPNVIDAFFEITSGFTTTGATILEGEEIESLSHSILFFRSFSHWIGGMGILVFILAIIPESNDGSSIYILKAESTGPNVGKLVSKTKVSSRILYLIYIAITLLEVLLLVLGPKHQMNLFTALNYAFSTAGTGGFGLFGDSVASFLPYYQYVIATFMLIFGINFTLFYLILIGNAKEALRSEELRWYIVIIILSVIIIMCNILKITSSFEEAFRYSYFNTTTLISTTGFSIVDYNNWPAGAKIIMILLTFVGSCAGSTSGGLKLSRMMILCKSTVNNTKKMVNPRKVNQVKVNNANVSDETIQFTQGFFIIYLMIFVFCALLISVDGLDIGTNFSASLSSISNTGLGFSKIGPSGNYASFSGFSKIVLSIEMIIGRLEIFPILALLNPKTWIKKKGF